MPLAEISDSLRGKKIVNVYYKYNGYSDNIFANDSESLGTDAGDIYIELNDGTVIRVWNSEWGGIDLTDINNYDFVKATRSKDAIKEELKLKTENKSAGNFIKEFDKFIGGFVKFIIILNVVECFKAKKELSKELLSKESSKELKLDVDTKNKERIDKETE